MKRRLLGESTPGDARSPAALFAGVGSNFGVCESLLGKYRSIGEEDGAVRERNKSLGERGMRLVLFNDALLDGLWLGLVTLELG